MIALIDEHLDELADLCRQYQVGHLDLFGSAATADFGPAASDLDFIVAYRSDADPDPWFRKHLQLQATLAELFDRPVDLVIERHFKNPYFAEAVEQTRIPLYAA